MLGKQRYVSLASRGIWQTCTVKVGRRVREPLDSCNPRRNTSQTCAVAGTCQNVWISAIWENIVDEEACISKLCQARHKHTHIYTPHLKKRQQVSSIRVSKHHQHLFIDHLCNCSLRSPLPSISSHEHVL